MGGDTVFKGGESFFFFEKFLETGILSVMIKL